MKVAVIGSRTFSDYEWMKEILDTFDITHIVSGGNGNMKNGEPISGADKFAVKYAKEKGIPFTEHYPNWNLHGKAAGPIRNKLIVDDSVRIIAFWDNQSKGTLSSLDYAHQEGKETFTFPLSSEQDSGIV